MNDVYVGPKNLVSSFTRAPSWRSQRSSEQLFHDLLKEASQKNVELPEASVRAFELFNNWLYTGDANKQAASGDKSTRT